jgi:hypothetical protein
MEENYVKWRCLHCGVKTPAWHRLCRLHWFMLDRQLRRVILLDGWATHGSEALTKLGSLQEMKIIYSCKL